MRSSRAEFVTIQTQPPAKRVGFTRGKASFRVRCGRGGSRKCRNAPSYRYLAVAEDILHNIAAGRRLQFVAMNCLKSVPPAMVRRDPLVLDPELVPVIRRASRPPTGLPSLDRPAVIRPPCRANVTCRARTGLPRCCHLPVPRPACRTALKRMN
jgi:hypothetical protein